MKTISLEAAKKLKGYQRYRLRKQGVAVPFIPHRRGYKQTADHVAKRIRRGESHHAWKGNDIKAKSGRSRALRLYPEIGPCILCGSKKSERHHIDGNTANNDPGNILIICRRCHMKNDGRLETFRALAVIAQPMGVKARWANQGK